MSVYLTNKAEFQRFMTVKLSYQKNVCIPSSKGFHYIKFGVLVLWNSKVQHLIEPDEKKIKIKIYIFLTY